MHILKLGWEKHEVYMKDIIINAIINSKQNYYGRIFPQTEYEPRYIYNPRGGWEVTPPLPVKLSHPQMQNFPARRNPADEGGERYQLHQSEDEYNTLNHM